MASAWRVIRRAGWKPFEKLAFVGICREALFHECDVCCIIYRCVDGIPVEQKQ